MAPLRNTPGNLLSGHRVKHPGEHQPGQRNERRPTDPLDICILPEGGDLRYIIGLDG